jgi:hypothetical protein
MRFGVFDLGFAIRRRDCRWLAIVMDQAALFFQSLLRGLPVEMTVAVARSGSWTSPLVPQNAFCAFDSRLAIESSSEVMMVVTVVLDGCRHLAGSCLQFSIPPVWVAV